MFVLGISSFFHDSAAVLLKNGKMLCAFEEERFSRIKHDNSFPTQSVEACLAYANLKIEDIKCVAYYEKPLRKFERILETFARTYPYSIKKFASTILDWSGGKLSIEATIRKKLGYTGEIYFYSHHLSHAASSFYTSPYKDAAVLVVDGVGEYETTSLWRGSDADIKLINTINFPNSLGLFYSTITAFLGFRVNNDEYKVMGLAAYGEPRYVDSLRSVIKIAGDGSFTLDMRFFAFEYGEQMWTSRLEKILGKPRKHRETIEQIHKDIACSLQKVTEEVYMGLLRELHKQTNNSNLCIGGGVALNVVANGKVTEETPFNSVYVFGPAGDSGAAVGAAVLAHREVNKKASVRQGVPSLSLGLEYSNEEIEEELKESECRYSIYSEDDLISKVAEELNNGSIVAWFQERMEFGPRALGNRSILAHPGFKDMKQKINTVKNREDFRPFAVSVLREYVDNVFSCNVDVPYMNICLTARESYKKRISSVVHKDGTTRVQTVDKSNGDYFELLQAFYRLSGLPCVLNTSFNVNGEPIVESPRQAISAFKDSEIEYLAIGSFLVCKR